MAYICDDDIREYAIHVIRGDIFGLAPWTLTVFTLTKE